MANEVTWSQITHLLPDIWETALDYISFNFVMPTAVKVFTDETGFRARDVSTYVEGAAPTQLDELEDMSPAILERELLARLIPDEYGKQYLITDRRRETDDANIVADAAGFLGYELGKYVEQVLLTDMASFTGGTVGSAGSALTWALIYDARARLRGAGIAGPYSVVLHEYQYFDLAVAANIANITNANPLQIRDTIQNQYYVGSVGDMNFYVTSLLSIDGSDDAIGGMFARDAIALDMRRGFRIEPERDASLRATELNATMVFAHGVWQPSHGVKILSDSTAPGSAVSQTSTLVVTGFGDDLSTTSGQDEHFTFTITNTGTTVARDILVTFTVDSDFTYLSYSSNMGTFNSTTKIWQGFELAPGQVAVINLTYDIAGAGAMVCTVTSATPTPSPATPAATVTLTFS